MDPEPRIDKDIFGKSRHEVCEKVALDFMGRQAPYIAERVQEAIIYRRQQADKLGVSLQDLASDGLIVASYRKGHVDGFAMALELILSGALNIQEIEKTIPDGSGDQEDLE